MDWVGSTEGPTDSSDEDEVGVAVGFISELCFANLPDSFLKKFVPRRPTGLALGVTPLESSVN